jgi:hypothetical protein
MTAVRAAKEEPMHIWQVAVCGLVLAGWLLSAPRAAEQPSDGGPDHRRGSGELATNMRERWKAINEIAMLINAGHFPQASNLAKHVLPLPKDLTPGDLQELAEEFDARVKAFRQVLEVRDPMPSLQAWNTVFQGCVGCHMEHGIKGQKLQE